jgi:SNF2 family DNA or RNA helicase
VRAISPLFEYRYAVTATPIQNDLENIHGICEAIGMGSVVGNLAWFRRAFCIRERVQFWVKTRTGSARRSKTITTGYRNLDQLRDMLSPWFVRRKRTDPEVAKHLPLVQSVVVRPALTRRQGAAYAGLLRGIQVELRDGRAKPRYVDTVAKFSRLLAVSDGLQTLDPEMVDESGKSDWLLDRLQNAPDWAGEKVIVFSRFARSVEPIARRLTKAGISYAKFMGTSWQSEEGRSADLQRFLTDPECRVLLATAAIEMGLNLQVARIMVFYGIIPNPKRLEQIMGRIQRAGSPFSSVMAFTLIAGDTVEGDLWDSVIERNAVADYFWQEESGLFEKLGNDRLLQLIQGAQVG